MSALEDQFAMQLRAVGLPDPEREYRFHPVRRWKFDFAFPAMLPPIAVEIEGGTRQNGRHNRHSGYQADCEKYNTAILNGWRVLRFTSDMVKSGSAVATVEQLFNGLSGGEKQHA
jgi:very-short-patch-repair endonuclease